MITNLSTERGLPMSSHANSYVAHQFDSMEQQKSSATLGMWLFLATEIMFFGGFFMAYIVYRLLYPAGFQAASEQLDVWLATVNTVFLLSSSFFVALAVHAGQLGHSKKIALYLGLTMLMALLFLGFKAYEYHHEYVEMLIPGLNFTFPAPHEKSAMIFFSLYFGMTGMHALHMIIGVAIMIVLIIMSLKNKFNAEYHNPIEIFGLYWHFVDIVWLFIWPLLYMISPQF